MQVPPFRTNETWLTEDQLILLDVLFDGDIPFRLLCREGFRAQWNLGYAHDLDDRELGCHLRWLCEHGVLESVEVDGFAGFRMTAAGGELWSRERCPVWKRYCTDSYTTTSRNRTRMSVLAVSPNVRDAFLARWPQHPARRRTATISDPPLIGWHPFDRVYAGIAVYHEPRSWTPEEAIQHRQHWAMLERERSWWRSVPELQRFVGSINPPATGVS